MQGYDARRLTPWKRYCKLAATPLRPSLFRSVLVRAFRVRSSFRRSWTLRVTATRTTSADCLPSAGSSSSTLASATPAPTLRPHHPPRHPPRRLPACSPAASPAPRGPQATRRDRSSRVGVSTRPRTASSAAKPTPCPESPIVARAVESCGTASRAAPATRRRGGGEERANGSEAGEA